MKLLYDQLSSIVSQYGSRAVMAKLATVLRDHGENAEQYDRVDLANMLYDMATVCDTAGQVKSTRYRNQSKFVGADGRLRYVADGSPVWD